MFILQKRFVRSLLVLYVCLFLLISGVFAQVSSVEFGKNRLQFKKLKWQYYQTSNFNAYFNQDGQELAKYVAQIAEKDLSEIETFVEYSMQRRANIVIYNSFLDLRQSNIGMGIDWQNTGGVTKLVNNKMIVYFNGDHNDLRRQVREGIARILTQNLLFGDDLGEFASNQTLLDLPVWLTDGYVSYAAINWSTSLDDDLKSEMLSGKFKNFYQFAFDKPLLAGHSFWYYIEEKYKKENVTYLLYLARVYKNLNRACMQVTKKKFKDLLKEFMEYQETKYSEDVNRRKNYPKGSEITSEIVNNRKDYFRFNVNPNKRNGSFAVVQFKRGQYRVLLNEEDEYKTLIKIGAKSNLGEIDPTMPLMAWDTKGTRLAVFYGHEGKIKLNIYDVVTKLSPLKRDLTEYFQLVQDVKYLDTKTLLLSAVKNGHSDLFTYDIENEKVLQITNDIYDDLDPSFVAFPGKNGIIFASNRPSPGAKSADTVLPNNRYNIFLVQNFGGKAELNQITQLTNLKFGNGRLPTQYNTNHFTFVNDENGIGNRYAGFFTTESEGLDTLVLIGDDILRNPSPREVDSTLRVYKKDDVDSIAVVAVSKDSAYSFPLTNYASSLRETRIAGDNNQVSEVTRQSDDKILYKLKIDENALRRRNVGSKPTAYMKRLMQLDRQASGVILNDGQPVDSTKKEDIFQNEFGNEPKDSSVMTGKVMEASDPFAESVLGQSKLYPYKPPKYSTDYIVSGFNNSVLATRYQVFTGSGPITLASSTPLNGIIRMGVSDLMEDLKFTGGVRLSTNLKDNDWLFQFQNLRKRIDWGFTFYRSVQEAEFSGYPGNIYANLYQGSISYPFDAVKSIRLNLGARRDRLILKTVDGLSSTVEDLKTTYSLAHIEFVYDNTLNPAQNIWDGLRYKVFFDWNAQVNKLTTQDGKNTFNLGFDARYYYPIYRNFIYALRTAADFSFGNQKMIYYLGGIDNWLMLGQNEKVDQSTGTVKYRYFNPGNAPDPDQTYAFQSLAVNMRGFIQNVANGNNAIVINSEFRLPVFATLFSRPINNAFLRNFQLTQFVDLGTAWNGKYDKIERPSTTYLSNDPNNNNPVSVLIKNGGIGPFVGGYGFGARSTLLGYFLKVDAGWQMNGIFKGKPIWYLSLGLDF